MGSEPNRRAMQAICELARAQYPQAIAVEGRWYAGEPYAEVWLERGRAINVFAGSAA